MTLEKLTEAMYAAMKAKNKPYKDEIAALVSSIKKAAIDKGCRDAIPELLVDEVILKEQKVINEMVDTCPADRTDLLEEYKLKAKIVAEFAPTMMTEDEIAMELFMFCEFEGLDLTKANRAKIMKSFMPTLKGRADGKLANKVITEVLE